MPRQDFYITFGSDISDFNAGLLRELARTEEIVQQFDRKLSQLGSGGGASNSPLAKLLDQIQQAQTGAGSAATPKSTPEVTAMERASKTFTTEINRLIQTIKGEQKSTSLRDAPRAGSTASIANVPKVAIDEAAFARVVEAIDRGTNATGRVEAAVERLVAAIGGRNAAVAAGAGDRQQGRDAANAVRPRTQEQWDALSQNRRNRLTRAGVTPELYLTGQPLPRFRGTDVTGPANAATTPPAGVRGNTNDILNRILTEVTGFRTDVRNRTGSARAESGSGGGRRPAAASKTEPADSGKQAPTKPFVSDTGRAIFLEELKRTHPEIARMVEGENKLAAGVRLVTELGMKQRQVVDLLGHTWARTRTEAEEALRREVGGEHLVNRAAALQEIEQQRQAELARASEPQITPTPTAAQARRLAASQRAEQKEQERQARAAAAEDARQARQAAAEQQRQQRAAEKEAAVQARAAAKTAATERANQREQERQARAVAAEEARQQRAADKEAAAQARAAAKETASQARQARAAQTELDRQARAAQKDQDRQDRAAVKAQEREQREAANAATAAASAQRRQIATHSASAEALDKVGASSRQAVAELARLAHGGETEERVVQARRRAYALLDQDLKRQGVAGSERKKAIGQVFEASGHPMTGPDLTGVARSVVNLTPTLKAAGGAAGDEMGNETRNHFAQVFGATGFYGRVVHSVGTFLVRNMSAGLVFGLTNALQDAISQAIQTESTFVRVSEALKDTGRSVGGLRTELSDLSQQTGVTLQDTYETAAALTGLFDSTDQGNRKLADTTKVATQMELISGGALNATEAVRSLTSVTAAFKDTSVKAVGDVATVIQTRLGVNIEDTTEGVARLSGQARLMGLSFEETATYVASISKFTGQSGAGAGEQFSRILDALTQAPKQQTVRRALGSVNVDVETDFANRDYSSIIKKLLGNFDKLSAAEQTAITSLAGPRQAGSMSAWFADAQKVLSTLDATLHSEGATAERAAALNGQLAAELRRLRASFVAFFEVLERTGVLDTFGLAMRVILNVFEKINHALNWFNDQTDKLSAVSDFQHLALIVGGIALSFKVATIAARNFMAVLALPQNVAKIAAAQTAGTTGGMLAGGGLAAATGRATTRGAVVGTEEAVASGAATGAAATAASRGMLRTIVGGIATGIGAVLFGSKSSRDPAKYVSPVQTAYRARLAEQQMAVAAALGGAAAFPPLMGGRNPVYSQNRYGNVDENGVGTGRTQRFFQRQAIRAEGAFQNRAAPWAERWTQGASARAAEAEGRIEQGLARAHSLAAAGARAAATSMEKLSNGLALMAANAGKTIIGILALVAAAVSLWQVHNDNKDQQESANRVYQQMFGGEAKKTENQTRVDELSKPATDALKKSRDDNNGILHTTGNWLGAVFSKNNEKFDTSRPEDYLTLGLAPYGRNIANKILNKDDRDTGAIPNKEFGQYIDLWHKQNSQWQNLGKNGPYDEKAVKKLEDQQLAAVKKAADKVRHSNLSGAQKQNLLAQYARVEAAIEDHAKQYMLVADGMSKADSSTSDMIDSISQVATTLVSMSNSSLKRNAKLIASWIDQLGFKKDSAVRRDLDILRSGTVTTTTTSLEPTVGRPGPGSGVRIAEDLPNGQVVGIKPVRHSTTRAATLRDKQKASIDAMQHELDSAWSRIAGELKTNPELALEDTNKAIQLSQNIDQARAAILQGDLSSAQALQAYLASQGKYGAAAGTEAQVEAAIRALGAQQGLSKPEIDMQIQQARDTSAQYAVTQATEGYENEKLGTRNAVDLARINLDEAKQTVKTLRAKHASKEKIRAALISEKQAKDAYDDSQNSFQISQLQTQLDINTAPGNALAQARNAVTIARAQMDNARKEFGVNSQQYQDSLRSYVDAGRGVDQALADRAQAVYTVLIAYANAAGETVKAARLTVRQAHDAYEKALKKAGGDTQDPTVQAAHAQEITARASARDARLQNELDTIDFNKQMGRISSEAAISELQHILDTEKLTKAQRHQIMLEIHGLQQDLRNQLTSSGFNIPGGVALPTAYQVRRSLGIDHARTLVKNSIDDLTNSAKPNALASSGSTGLVNAMNAVRDAVVAKGAQHVKVDQKNTYHVPTAAVARQIADQVISIINQQNGQHVRANASTPRLVQTR